MLGLRRHAPGRKPAFQRHPGAVGAVAADLNAGDVRLTMGGEPTFVSIDDPDGEEWNTAAVGPTKSKLATTLLCRLRARKPLRL